MIFDDKDNDDYHTIKRSEMKINSEVKTSVMNHQINQEKLLFSVKDAIS